MRAQHFSFYDLIVTKARGKSGPLFHFDVHDDIRIVHDTRIEKDESHPGKVCVRYARYLIIPVQFQPLFFMACFALKFYVCRCTFK